MDTAKAAEFFLADGLIVTGNATGDPANANDLKLIKETSKLPVIIGSGVTIDNLSDYLEADALIIGSHFKQNGDWMNVLDGERINNFMNKILHTVS